MTPNPKDSRTPIRTVRVSDEMWHAFKEASYRSGTTASDRLRKLVADFVADHPEPSYVCYVCCGGFPLELMAYKGRVAHKIDGYICRYCGEGNPTK